MSARRGAELDESLLDLIKVYIPDYIVQRGRRYYREGRVLDFRLEGNVITGLVQGSRDVPYRVRLELTGDDLHARCTCPFGFFCKHAVALALAVDEWMKAVAAGSEGSSSPPGWEDYLRLGLALPERFDPAPGTTVLVIRLRITGEGRLVLDLRKARWGKRGLGAEKPVSPGRYVDVAAACGSPGQRALILELARRGRFQLSERLTVPAGEEEDFLERLARLPFVFWEDGDRPPVLRRPPLRGRLVVTEHAGGAWRLTAALAEPDGRPWTVPDDTGVWYTPARLWLVTGNVCYPVDADYSPRLMFAAMTEEIAIPPAEVGRFIEQYLPLLEDGGREVLAPELAARVLTVRPRPVLTLREEGKRLCVEVAFAYGDGPAAVRPGDGTPGVVEAVTGDALSWVRCDRGAERAFLERLEGMGLVPDADGVCRLSGEDGLDFIARHLPVLEQEAEIYGARVLKRYRVRRGGTRPVVRLTSGPDWLDLDVSLDYGEGRVRTETLIPALQAGARYVRLRDGSYLPLSEEWAAAARELLAEGGEPRLVRGRLRLARHNVSLAAAWLERAARAEADEGWREFSRCLQDFRGIPEAPLPRGLRAELRPYQRQGYNWLNFLRRYNLGGILADEMGLGKTVQALALLLAAKEENGDGLPSLIVAPTSLVFNWREEAARFAPDLSVLGLVGPGRHEDFERLGEYDVVLTTYALLPRDGEKLAAQPFNYIVLDEAQRIKNPSSQAARAVKALQARHRLALTGTPLENNLMELWSIFDFLMPGFLGSRERFLSRYARPIEQDGDRAARERLRRRVYPFVLRRRKQDVARELPPKTEAVLTCEMTPGQRRLYEQVLTACRARVFAAVEEKGLGASTVTILDALLKLRQICCHPRLLKLPGNRVTSSAKLELFKELIADITGQGHRVLVFSQFVEALAILREELERMGLAYEYLDGQTRDRAERVHRFNTRDDIPVFLLSLKAGGVGLNLTAANYVVLFDPWWNPAVEDQAADRSHRLGQDRPVFCYRLVTRGTVEEKILALHARKRALAEGLLGGDGAWGKHLTREDLEELFTF